MEQVTIKEEIPSFSYTILEEMKDEPKEEDQSDDKLFYRPQLVKSYLESISTDNFGQMEQVAIKEESPEVSEELEDIIEPKEELQSDEETPPQQHESDSDTMEFKVEVEEEDVLEKIHRAANMTSTPHTFSSLPLQSTATATSAPHLTSSTPHLTTPTPRLTTSKPRLTTSTSRLSKTTPKPRLTTSTPLMTAPKPRLTTSNSVSIGNSATKQNKNGSVHITELTSTSKRDEEQREPAERYKASTSENARIEFGISHDHRYEISPGISKNIAQRLKTSNAQANILSQRVKRLKFKVSYMKSLIKELRKKSKGSEECIRMLKQYPDFKDLVYPTD
ncbi:hypothetical protein PYW08_012330 [Mythimna loreyi]|uniref:Uncharacterized protein n=1 Tax=Mythimna loreyi TaxID=667449 RepID=A0ACC2PZY8_9NEOP|nr:hypothetical protein PYW08_012330 [Mythimna loreyi]